MNNGWSEWQELLLENYCLGYTEHENLEELSNEIGKSLNAVKIKLSRYRERIEEYESRDFTFEEYKIFLANRFDKSTKEVASLIGVSEHYLLQEIEELDGLECQEFLEEDFQHRPITEDEYLIFSRLYEKKRNPFQICQILNRDKNIILEMINKYESQVRYCKEFIRNSITL